MSWEDQNSEMTLLCYQGEWYRTIDDLRRGFSVMQYFDIVVKVTGNKFNVIKDRHTGVTGRGIFSDVLRMKLFAQGKTFYDLPEFTKSYGIKRGAASVLAYRDNGDLYESAELTGIK